MRIAICDDDPLFLKQLREAVRLWQAPLHCPLPEAFEDGDSLMRAHTAAPFDVIFLDVVMPLLSGIDTAREIRQHDRSVKIVFLTSSPEFAVDSYTVKASNYLLKPLDTEKLQVCLNELWTEIHSSARCINIKCANTVRRVELRSIAFLEAQNKHVQFTLTDGTCFVATEPLYSFEHQLSEVDGFFKCSRSYIVNLYQIESYNTREIAIRGGFRVPISRNRHREFEACYFQVIFGKAGEAL